VDVLFFLFSGLIAKRLKLSHKELKDVVLPEYRAIELLSDPSPKEEYFVFGPINTSQNTIYSLWSIIRKWGSFSND